MSQVALEVKGVRVRIHFPYIPLYQKHVFRRSPWFPAVSSPVIPVSAVKRDEVLALTALLPTNKSMA